VIGIPADTDAAASAADTARTLPRRPRVTVDSAAAACRQTPGMADLPGIVRSLLGMRRHDILPVTTIAPGQAVAHLDDAAQRRYKSLHPLPSGLALAPRT